MHVCQKLYEKIINTLFIYFAYLYINQYLFSCGGISYAVSISSGGEIRQLRLLVVNPQNNTIQYVFITKVTAELC